MTQLMSDNDETSTSPVGTDATGPAPAVAPAEGFGVRSARGSILLTLMQVAASLIGFGTQIALSWFLLPEDFGTVAVAVSISGLIAVIRDAGAPLILVQRQHEFDRIAGSVFWMTLTGATLCGLLTAGAAPIVAHVKGNPVLLPVMLLTALRFPIGALGTISYTRLTVDLRWGMVAAVNLLVPVVMSGSAILMAYLGAGVYALLIPPMLADMSRGFVSWLATGKRFRLRPDMALISGIVVSSVWIVLSNLTLAARGFADFLTLSFTRDEHETGLYFYAFVAAQSLSRLALGAGPSVLAPVFSKVKHDEARHADILIKAIHMFAAMGVLTLTMQAAMTWPLFRLFLNPKWLGGAPIFCIITVMILACFLNLVIFQAVWANGLYKQFFTYSIVFTPVMVLLFLIGVKINGSMGVAWANLLAGVLDFIFYPIFALPLLKVPWKRAIPPLWRPLVAAIPTALLALFLHHALPVTKTADVLRILITGTVGSIIYLLILWFLWREIVRSAWSQVAGALGVLRR